MQSTPRASRARPPSLRGSDGLRGLVISSRREILVKAFVIDSIIRDIANIGAEARPIKILLRSPWERPMADEQRRLVVLRRQLTELLVTLAHQRGRLHQRTRPLSSPTEGVSADWDAEAHAAAVAERVFARYAPKPPPALASAPATAVHDATGAATEHAQ